MYPIKPPTSPARYAGDTVWSPVIRHQLDTDWQITIFDLYTAWSWQITIFRLHTRYSL
jgi:hypothetical protein